VGGALLIADTDLFSAPWFRNQGVVIAIVVAAALVISWLGTAAVRRFRRRLEGSPDVTGPLEARRAATLATTLVTAIRIVVWTLTVLIVLGALGVDLAPLVASAGIAGIALSFGAQSMVKDFLSGFFVLLEDQFAVGDVVDLALAGGQPLLGRVETLTLRATAVRSSDGTLAITGNGNILAVRNHSRGQGELRVEVTVPRAPDLAKLRRRLEAAVAELRRDAVLQALISSGPEVVDVVPTDDGGAVTIVAAQALAARRDSAEEILRRRLATFLLSPSGAPGTDGT
jgi:small conductance mechanosensitive channel